MRCQQSGQVCQNLAGIFSVLGFCCTMRINKTAWALGLALPGSRF